MQQFVDSTVTAADNLLPRIQIAIKGIGKLIEQLLPVIMDKVPQIIADTLPGLISAGISMVSALAQGIMDYAPQLISYAAELLVQFDTRTVHGITSDNRVCRRTGADACHFFYRGGTTADGSGKSADRIPWNGYI